MLKKRVKNIVDLYDDIMSYRDFPDVEYGDVKFANRNVWILTKQGWITAVCFCNTPTITFQCPVHSVSVIIHKDTGKPEIVHVNYTGVQVTPFSVNTVHELLTQLEQGLARLTRYIPAYTKEITTGDTSCYSYTADAVKELEKRSTYS